MEFFLASAGLPDTQSRMGIQQLNGMSICFEGEAEGRITEETVDQIHIESEFFTGWMAKTEFWDAWGIDED